MGQPWTIRPLCFGEFPSYEKSWLTYLHGAGEKIRVPVLGWLVESSDQTVLVDTGPPAPDIASQWHTRMEQAAEQRPDVAIRAAGVDPATLEVVILTHLHWDHCNNVGQFPNARLLVQARELKAAVQPVSCQRLTYEVGVNGLSPAWLGAFDRLHPVDGDVEVAKGLRVVPLPGHTPGFQGVLVETRSGRYLIAGDAMPLYQNLTGVQPIPPGLHYSVPACLRSFARMREIADAILPGHDTGVLQHSAYPPG